MSEDRMDEAEGTLPESAEDSHRLRALEDALANLTQHEAPPGLLADVMAALPPAAAATAHPVRRAAWREPRWQLTALAAGLGVLAIGLVLDQQVGTDPAAEDLAGTLMTARPGTGEVGNSALRLSLESLQGSISADNAGESLRLQLDLEVGEEVELVFSQGSEIMRRTLTPGSVREFLTLPGHPDSSVRITVVRSGTPVGEYLLDREVSW
ncbi:MAG: hypothetical protein ACO23E_08105 [Steroidobacteraceae bacterium]